MTPQGSDEIERTPRTRLKRFPQRAVYERETLYGILDEGLICHLAFADESGQPFAIPTAYARVGDDIYIHGSSASRTLRAASGGIPVCLTVTLTDGIVLARSAFNHSFNYRSVFVLGTATPVTDPAERELALKEFAERLVPGRWPDVRKPTRQEIKATALLTLPIEEASAKIRTGMPVDEGDDLEHPAWAGVIPLELAVRAPVTDPGVPPQIEIPAYVRDYERLRHVDNGGDPAR